MKKPLDDGSEKLEKHPHANFRKYHKRGSMPKIECDEEIKRIVEEYTPRLAYDRVSQICRERLGKGRAPSRSAIGRYWKNRMMALGKERGTAHRSKIGKDSEIRKFIDNHLEYYTFCQLETMCRSKFEPSRAPSKTAIHRYFHGQYKCRSVL